MCVCVCVCVCVCLCLCVCVRAWKASHSFYASLHTSPSRSASDKQLDMPRFFWRDLTRDAGDETGSRVTLIDVILSKHRHKVGGVGSVCDEFMALVLGHWLGQL